MHIYANISEVFLFCIPAATTKGKQFESYDAEFFADASKRLDGSVDFLVGVRSRDLHPDSGFTFGHDGITEADDVDAFLQQTVGHFQCISGVTEIPKVTIRPAFNLTSSSNMSMSVKHTQGFQ